MKTYLGITSSSYDSLLTNLINSVSAEMERRTHRKLKSRAYDYRETSSNYDLDNAVLDGNGEDIIFTPQYPVTELTTLMVYNITTVGGVESGYVLYPNIGKIYYADTFAKYPKSIGLVYTAGYRTTDPEYFDLESIVCQIVGMYYNLRTKFGMYSEKIGDYSYISLGGLMRSPIWEDLLIKSKISRYKDHREFA